MLQKPKLWIIFDTTNLPIQTKNTMLMKKLFFSLLCTLLVGQIASAQNKGEKYAGGIIGISTTSVSSEGVSASTTEFSLAPEFGYFVLNRLRVGGSLAYGLASSDGTTTHTLTIGPNVAYYVKLCDKLYYTPELNLGFAYASTDDISACGFTAGIALGAFEYKPATRWGITLNLVALEYAVLSYPDLDISNNAVSFRLGIKPTIGIKYYF